jgi:hypothetical protein
MQVVPPVHVFPQAPQLVSEVATSTQAPPQLTVPIEQLSTQVPLLHTLLGGQALPQAPQFCGSEARVTQALPQGVVPMMHRHEPLQNWVGAQARSQEPQWSREMVRFSQEPPQLTSPAAQPLFPQWPWLQKRPAGQACPQPPQCRRSAWVSTHWPLQLVCPWTHPDGEALPPFPPPPALSTSSDCPRQPSSSAASARTVRVVVIVPFVMETAPNPG